MTDDRQVLTAVRAAFEREGLSGYKEFLQGGSLMVSNRSIHPVIVLCFLIATIMLGGCSPPIPKTWLPSSGDTRDNTILSIDR